MKYRCSHCDHKFQLAPRDFQRCPNCFWTTSLEPFESELMEAGPKGPPSKRKKTMRVAPLDLPPSLIVFVVLACVAGVWIAGSVVIQSQNVGSRVAPPERMGLPEQPETKPQLSVYEFQKTVESLPKDEYEMLTRRSSLELPRALSEDEDAILKKQVILPENLLKKPVISMWTKEKLKSRIEREEKKRKITLGWGYVRSVVKVFETHYLAAGEAFEADNFALARNEFMAALALPVYENNVERHRAVALVIVRSYVNDVLGKVAVINQYLAGQKVAGEAEAIKNGYTSLFSLLAAQNWEESEKQIASLKARVDQFEQRSTKELIAYPPVFGTLDTELQKAVRTESAPRPDALVNWKPMLVDLGLKEKVVRENLPKSIQTMEGHLEEAAKLIEKGEWRKAREKLRQVTHPIELVREAKQKLALVGQILALAEA